ncbi:chromosome partitioning protein ParA [Eubacteriales bacterium]|uniref:ParA family protein n=1 Tax=Anaerotruncus TaxID=244127 RepID=UPI000E50FCC5|nr:ParA family protein [Anaerotruncus sp. AF02-27]MCM0707195.1 ParA family protein [Faecalicatena sp. BF-R-105]GKH48143.1 chromosome partitioning protein ParA [Oscillospiraceae bacterium]GKH49981.1 chromosome partitioning protein ParA [Eubacteriales bacterium]RGX53446.1 ParA family protein [Anaerotruncus sp. AF02-27]GKH62617.1 chromosome partitioning protein ParA [Eubacteriales bacterium]
MSDCKIIAVANRKGGVGKTTITLNLGYALAEKGYRILLVDFDSQANLSKGLGISAPAKDENTICQPMWADIRDLDMPDRESYIKQRGKLHFISCNETLSVLEMEMVGAMRREYILKNILDELRGDHDFILIDCGPSLGVLTVNALIAADSTLVVSTLESDSNEGTKLLVKSIQLVRKKYRHMLEVDGILMNMVVDRTILSREMMAETKRDFGEAVAVFETNIPRTSLFGRAKKAEQTIFEYAPKSKGAAAFSAFCEEFLAKGGYADGKR